MFNMRAYIDIVKSGQNAIHAQPRTWKGVHPLNEKKACRQKGDGKIVPQTSMRISMDVSPVVLVRNYPLLLFKWD